jgi:hypothetical protein
MDIAYRLYSKIYNVEPSYNFLNTKWMEAIDKGIISGDLNKDGDMDDKKELEIQDHNKLLKHLNIPLRYLGSFPPDIVINDSQYAIGEFYNKRTDFTHFVSLDSNKKVEYDPIKDSVTVREGTLKTIRLYGV